MDRKTEEMGFEYFWGTAWKKAIPSASIEGPNVHKSQYIPLEYVLRFCIAYSWVYCQSLKEKGR